MKNLLLFATVLLSVLLSSCSDDEPTPMVWEFSDYDRDAVSAIYSPDYAVQVAIAAAPGYSGDITLKCTSYRQLTLGANNADGTFRSAEAGFYVRKIDDNTLRITFEPIEITKEDEIYDFVSADGKNGKETNVTNISVGRVRK